MGIPLPPGVTKSSLATSLSRGNPLSVGGSAIVACVHGRTKRANANAFAVDLRHAKPHLCPCCQNLYAKPSDVPGPCPTCDPTGGPNRG